MKNRARHYRALSQAVATALRGSENGRGNPVVTVGSPFDGADLRKIACHESPGLLQFRPSPGPPVFGPGGDVGIMQMCKGRTGSDVWNWQSNVASGRDRLLRMKDRAEDWLDDMVDDGATAYTTEMWQQESVHRYNAGTGGSGDAYWEWLGGEWVAVKNGGAPGYADTVLNLPANCQ